MMGMSYGDPGTMPPRPHTVIVPHDQSVVRVSEIWRYRELLYLLVWRDVKVRYKQALLGMAWAVIQPLMTMVVFTIIFGLLAKLPSDDIPYALSSGVALLPWQLFAGALQRASMSLVANANLMTKVYFPRLIIPVAAIIAGVVDFAVSLAVILCLVGFYHYPIRAVILTLPLFILLALLAATAVSIWLAALNVKYRDVQYVVPFLIQVWLYASPVAYSTSLIPSGLARVIYGLNPMAGVIQGFRWALLGARAPDELIVLSVIVVGVLLVSGLRYFRRVERVLADVV